MLAGSATAASGGVRGAETLVDGEVCLLHSAHRREAKSSVAKAVGRHWTGGFAINLLNKYL